MALDFSIVKGGPLYWLGRRLGMADGPRGLFQMAAILAAITWLPLPVLNLRRGSVGDGDPTLSFAWSLGTHTRLLAAIPLFGRSCSGGSRGSISISFRPTRTWPAASAGWASPMPTWRP